MQAKLSDDLLEGAAAAADYLGIRQRAIYRMTENGDLPAIRKGRKLFYRKSDLERAFQAAP